VESKELIKEITDTMPDVIYIIDIPDNKIVYVSSAVKSYGYSPETIYSMGTNVFNNLVHPDDYNRVVLSINDMLTFKDHEIRENSLRLKASDGDWRSVISRTVLFKIGQDGNPLRILGLIQDVTSKIKTEIAYQEEKNRSAELERINSLLDLFVHAAAHDLNGPTGNLMLLTELIKDANSEQKLELFERLEPIVKSLAKTVSSLMDIVKMEKESGKGIRKLNFKDVYDIVTLELNEEIKAADPIINLDFVNCSSIDYIETFLISIFRNIISNSLRYKHDERKLIMNISSDYNGNTAVLQFTDNGIGMDLKCFDKIFEPFTRFSSKSEGSGIGLYLINGMVTRNGGRIEVQSRLGEGTTFKVYLIAY